ncbi:hypothetical protein F6X40_09975 [Paraburkholderia sp. UCT31]|uniref:hypothetical protein n=1 Tax=Paraburkholderia sp. UCT31 TaxID=2615209 RepID=UPI00165615E1|nr:hypothetical protein [Paraburkholderia sp. UCT31]MBC8737134.1 hypothetical protein [Paraburkholderia sp. UCT31]
MEFNKTIYEKMHLGDKLTDNELEVAWAHFGALERMLRRCGSEWMLASQAAWREFLRLDDVRQVRQRNGGYRPTVEAAFAVVKEGEGFRVSRSDYAGGFVVPVEQFERAVEEARSEGREQEREAQRKQRTGS